MPARAEQQPDHHPPPEDSSRALSQSLGEGWRELCARFLPLAAEGSVWRYSRAPSPADPEQGWKLHVSSTILTANKVFGAVAPFLRRRGVLFKAPATLSELDRINSGLFYGYSQIGKFITVYPRSDAEAVSLARGLRRLTRGLSGPAVPFDLRYREGGCVFYRYGAFKDLELETHDGVRAPALRAPDGNLVPDVRERVPARPDWAADPLAARRRTAAAGASAAGPLQTTYRVFSALTQRGKGGVYKAVDVSAGGARLCVVKEGRRDGEVQWDGRDGRWRVEHEERVLVALRAAGLDVPRVYSSFEAGGNYYLVTEFVEGETLQALLAARRRRLPVARVLGYGARLAALLARIHAAGWVWRDCKPANVVVTPAGDLRPLDFEGACRISSPDPVQWGTPPFVAPEQESGAGRESPAGADLYALGVMLYLLLTGGPPVDRPARPVGRVRRRVPARVCDLVSRLLEADARRRPSAESAARRLTVEAARLSGARSARG